MRILWQSFLDPERHASYLDLLRAHLAKVAPAAEFSVVGLRPPDLHLHPLTELRCGIAAIRNAVWAEHEGYDVVVIGHFQEPCLDEARSAIAIPVVGMGESALLHASRAAERFCLATIDPVFIPRHEEQVRRLGLEHQTVGICSLDVAPDRFMAAMDPGPGRSQLLERVIAATRPLRESGAGLIVLAGGLPALALCSEGRLEIEGVEALDVIEIAAGQACAVAGLGGNPGVTGKAPAEAIEEFLAATGGTPVAPVR